MNKIYVDKIFEDAKKGNAGPGPTYSMPKTSFDKPGQYAWSLKARHHFMKKPNDFPGPGAHTIRSLSGEGCFRIVDSTHRSTGGQKISQAARLTKIMFNTDPGTTTPVPNFLASCNRPGATGGEMTKDERFDIFDREFNLREARLKPDPGQY
jgi:hypothetical protein